MKKSLRLAICSALLLASFEVLACGDLDLICQQQEGKLNISLPSIDPECRGDLCRVITGAGGEVTRTLDNIARELGKTPQAIQQCMANVSRCATEIMAAPVSVAAQAYIEGLYRQSQGRVKSFPPQLISVVQRYYEVDLRGVTYAEDINTGHGQTLAYCDRIFFTHSVSPMTNRDDLALTLHEMEHLVQCQKRGRTTFLAEYLLKGLVDIARNGTFDVHDLHEFEIAADAKANGLLNTVWSQLPSFGFPGAMNNNIQPLPSCTVGEVFMNTPGGACCTQNYSRCRNLTTGAVTCGMGGC